MKKKRKAWFTLIEIIIVVIIIGILMLIGLWFNRSHLASLKSNTKIEQVKSDFDTFFLQILNSSSYQGKQYDQATLTLSKGWESQQNQPITYTFLSSNQDQDTKEDKNQTASIFFTQDSDYQLTKLKLNDNESNSLTLTFRPYQFECSVDGQNKEQRADDKIIFTLQPKWWKEVCFQLQTSYCRIQSITCKTLSQN